MNKIIRTICLFTDSPSIDKLPELAKLKEKAETHNFVVQTIRLSSHKYDAILQLDAQTKGSIFLNLGTLTVENAHEYLARILAANNIHFNLDLTNEIVTKEHTKILYEIIQKHANKTFNFTYTFNNPPSSPYYPSANFEKNGFSVGLQPTDLTEDCKTLEEWFEKMKQTWSEIIDMFSTENNFLGIDTSIAPLFEGNSSLVNFIHRLGMNFNESVTTDTYLKITAFIKDQCPKNIGLCGLMFPCLEDFELAKEYEAGNFSIERNIFLSLHSGLGIDTYPIGIDEKPERVTEILQLIQGLSNKYKKPLSVRFVSDGKTKVNQKSDFKNQYLKDVVIKPL